jgi:hypothetical protein
MLVTVSWIEQKYNIFNRLYFNNELPRITFKVSRSKKSWGLATYIIKRSTGAVIPECIYISNYYDSPEHVKECTLLHEMIHIKDYAQNPEHYYKNNKKNRSYDAHGWWFMAEAKRLEQFGYVITRVVTKEEHEASSLSKSVERNIELKRLNTRIIAVYGKNNKVWFCKTWTDKVDNVIKEIKRSLDWFDDKYGGIDEIYEYSTTSPKYIERRGCNTQLCGWTMLNTKFALECEAQGFKFVKNIYIQ